MFLLTSFPFRHEIILSSETRARKPISVRSLEELLLIIDDFHRADMVVMLYMRNRALKKGVPLFVCGGIRSALALGSIIQC